MSNSTVKCDCLNFCGDDPWLYNGKAISCDERIKFLKEQEERKQFIQKIYELSERAQTDGKAIITAKDLKRICSMLPRN